MTTRPAPPLPYWWLDEDADPAMCTDADDLDRAVAGLWPACPGSRTPAVVVALSGAQVSDPVR